MRIVVVALSLVVAIVAAPALGAGNCGKLSLVDTAPLTVKGSRFKAGERVKLVVSGSASLSRIVRAGPGGGFAVVFKAAFDRCDPLLIRATGARGSRATIDLTQVACAPAP